MGLVGLVSALGIASPTDAARAPQPALTAEFGAAVRPQVLPEHRFAPAAINLWGKVSTADGGRPPPVTKVAVKIDPDVAFSPKGLPVCSGPRRAIRSPGLLKRNCREAMVGRGRAYFEHELGEASIRTTATLIAYNGGLADDGALRVGVFAFSDQPVTSPHLLMLLIPVEITRIGGPHRALRAVATVPPIAGGRVSLLGLRLRIKRLFRYEGSWRSYAMAKCRTGKLRIHAAALFEGEGGTSDAPSQRLITRRLTRPCRSEPRPRSTAGGSGGQGSAQRCAGPVNVTVDANTLVYASNEAEPVHERAADPFGSSR